VEVHYGEGVAIRIGPEPCADIREGGGEPVGVVTLNPERDSIVRATTSQILLSGSIGEPAFPSRPGSAAQATARNGGDGRSRATRSHAQRAPSRASMARLASTGPSPQ
jgi:hypothetical protein